MLSVLSLAIGHGEEVVIRADGDNAEETLTELSLLVSTVDV